MLAGWPREQSTCQDPWILRQYCRRQTESPGLIVQVKISYLMTVVHNLSLKMGQLKEDCYVTWKSHTNSKTKDSSSLIPVATFKDSVQG